MNICRRVITSLFIIIVCSSGQSHASSFVVPNGPTLNMDNQQSTTNNSTTSNAANQPLSTPSPQNTINKSISSLNFIKPVCTNSKCITQQMVKNTTLQYIDFSPVKTYIEITDLEKENECAPPLKTGVTVFRQIVEDGAGKIIEYNDGFCIKQGCAYFGGIDNEQCQ